METSDKSDESDNRNSTAKTENIRKSNGLEIVTYLPKFRLDFENLNREWLEKYFTVEKIDETYFANPEGEILSRGGQIFFSLLDHAVVGTCAIVKEGDDWELAKMAVTESAQGKGIGDALIRAALFYCQHEMNLTRVMLITNSTLAPAIHLYKKNGFKIIQGHLNPKYSRGDVAMEIEFPQTLQLS